MRFAILLILFFVLSGSAHAMQKCDDPDIADKNYTLVFKGKALSTVTLEEETRKIHEEVKSKDEDGTWTDESINGWFGKFQFTTFKIEELYKGDPISEAEIYHASHSIFGMDYVDGESYLIYTKRNKEFHDNYYSYRCDWEKVDEKNPSKLYMQAKEYKAKGL